MSDGLRVVGEGLKSEGTVENPLGSNGGEPIETWQRQAAHQQGYGADVYDGAPWCAIAVAAWFRLAGVEIDTKLIHPATGVICDHAGASGLFIPSHMNIPPGALMIRCGIHVGMVVRDRGNGIVDTIEGNVSHMVSRKVREKADWRFIVWPGLSLDSGPVAVEFRDSYGFDDLGLKPKVYGMWRSQAGRERKLVEYRIWAAQERPNWWTARAKAMRDGHVWYGFRTGPPGSYNKPWSFGGWETKETRDRLLKQYMERTDSAMTRTWKKRVPVPLGTDISEEGDMT